LRKGLKRPLSAIVNEYKNVVRFAVYAKSPYYVLNFVMNLRAFAVEIHHIPDAGYAWRVSFANGRLGLKLETNHQRHDTQGRYIIRPISKMAAISRSATGANTLPS
jgi:hypothetical protein